MTNRSGARQHGGTVSRMNHRAETSKTNRKGTGEGVSMENIKTLYHIFSSADGMHVDGGDNTKCSTHMHDLKGAVISEGAVVVSPRSDKNGSPQENVNVTKGTNKEKEFLHHFNYLSHFEEYSCSHTADVEKGRNKKDELPFEQGFEVALDWVALEPVDHLCDSHAKEGRDVEDEIFYNNSKRGGSHLKYHNVGGGKQDTSCSPIKGEKYEQVQGRRLYGGDAAQLRREANPREHTSTGEKNKNGFVSAPHETIYEAFASLATQMENKGTHFYKPFYMNSNVDKLLYLEAEKSKLERTEQPRGGAKITPLNWDRKCSTLTYLHSGSHKEGGEKSNGEQPLKTVLQPKCNVDNVEAEREQDPFLNFIHEEKSPDGIPFFEELSYREDFTSVIFDSHEAANRGVDKMDSLEGNITKKDLLRMDNFHTRDGSPIESENIFGGSTNLDAMKRGGGEGDPFSKELPIWQSSLLEGEIESNLFARDGDYFCGRETKGGTLHIGQVTKDEQICVGHEEVTGRDTHVEKPHQWGKSSRSVDLFQVHDGRTEGNMQSDSRIMNNSSVGRIQLNHELINLSDGSSSDMGWTRKGTTPPRGEASVGLLSLEEEYPNDCFYMMREEKKEGDKNALWGKYDFFDFEHLEEVGAPERGSPDWIGDISNGVTRCEVGTTKGDSHVGLLRAMRYQMHSKVEGGREKEVEDVLLTYHDHYLTEQRMMEEAAPKDDECSSFLDIIDEIVSISKDIICTNQTEDGFVEILQGGPDKGMDYSHIGGQFQMGLHLDVPVGEVVEPGHMSTQAAVCKDPPQDKIANDVYFHFEKLTESCGKREDSMHAAVDGADDGADDGASDENSHRLHVSAQQVAHLHWRNRSGETKDDTSEMQEQEDPQERPTCETTSIGADLPTMQLCEDLYRVLMCRNYLEALPVLEEHVWGGSEPMGGDR
ncbi:hypothetical protein AK88_03309 [Plasmodium fragile]|uniref:Uncharacterized protein n=1 Tax=Plasmodium fragile TaxID=5857 RepID=A0A0D9QJN5_PLAFR|nr:uncharacterized protein AK88_03309 [Plasmodium fragile]KJP87027.1 hypothetical protein AK88_03309 [Plasmodium fragile]